VLANDARLSQAFINLIVNAAHAIPEGAPDRHEIRLVTRTDDAGRAVVEVHDTGAGIPPEALARIFEMFFTTKPAGIGTGLGLSICRGIIAAHGGEIEVESEVGRGSVFRVTLPPLPPERALAPTPAAAPAATPSPRKARVLIVDDEEKLGKALAWELGGDHEVTVMTSGKDALDQIHAGARFDLILCDLLMPGTTGMALFEEVRRLDPAQADRVVFLTGGACTPETTRFLREVKNRRMEKPFDIDLLHAVVGEILG
jgi:CheY-like chemotaxis protein